MTLRAAFTLPADLFVPPPEPRTLPLAQDGLVAVQVAGDETVAVLVTGDEVAVTTVEDEL